MSRLFDGVDDQMVYPAPAAMTGTLTMLVVVKFAAASGWASLIEMENSGAADRATIGRNPTLGNNLYWSNGVSGLLSGGETMTSTTDWLVLGVTKSAGTTTPRSHKCIIGGANSHTDQTGTIADAGTSAGGVLRLGANADFANVRLAAAAIWHGTALTDSDFNTIAASATTQSIADLSPTWLVDDSDGFATDLIGANDRTILDGTADDADDPAGWVFGLGEAATYPSAIPDFARSIFPFAPAEDKMFIGRGRPGRLGSLGLMRGTGPHPHGAFERNLFLRLHPVFVTEQTYEKAGDLIAGALLAGDRVREYPGKDGSLTAGALLSGSRVHEFAGKAGSLIAAALLAGADVREAIETGALIADTTVSGADVHEAVEAGALIAAAQLRGADVFEASELGSLIAGTFGSGADVFTASETGTLMADTSASGASVKESAGKAGSLVAGTLLAGADVADHARAGSLIADTTLAGTRIREMSKAGSLQASALVAGAGVWEASRSGALLALASLFGADVSEHSRTGSLTPDTSLSGASQKEQAGKAGSLVVGAQLRAADVAERAETGSLVARALASASDQVTFARAASLVAGALAQGADVLVFTETGTLMASARLAGAGDKRLPPPYLEGTVTEPSGADGSVTIVTEFEGTTAIIHIEGTLQ